MGFIVNPGAMIRGDGNAPDDVAVALGKDAKITDVKRTGGPDEDGYFDYDFTSPDGNTKEVLIPSIPLERFHEGMPARVYIDGNSWMWQFAVKFLLEIDEPDEDEET